jgi:hypothetical protein
MIEDARTNLKAAIAKIGHLTAQVGKMEAAAERADESAQQATAELASYEGLDKEITKWRVDQVKRGRSTKTLPEKLKAKRTAEDELEQSEATRDAINGELDELQKRLKPLEAEREACAVAVIHEKGDELAQELSALNDRQVELVQILRGLSEMRINETWNAPLAGKTPAMKSAIGGWSYQFPINVNPPEDMGKRWKKRLDAVKVDPDADVTVPTMIVPEDYSFTTITPPGPPGVSMTAVPVAHLRTED